MLNSKAVNIVWLKRDLRSSDHEPLLKAECAGIPYLIIYVFEPSRIEYPDTSLRHLQFIYHSVDNMNKVLSEFNRRVELLYGEAIDVFDYLIKNFDISSVFSYQESGTQSSWERDKKIKKFCKSNEICWEQSQRDGILRGIKNREDWNKKWHVKMHASVVQNKYTISKETPLEHPFLIPSKLESELKEYPKYYQPAGEKNAWRYLKSFASKRGFNYQRYISKPMESRMSCSRLSPYLSWGNMSIKQAFQFIGTHPNRTKKSKPFSAMLTRLHWH